MVAVPNYARMNRVGQGAPRSGGDPSVNYAGSGAGGATRRARESDRVVVGLDERHRVEWTMSRPRDGEILEGLRGDMPNLSPANCGDPTA